MKVCVVASSFYVFSTCKERLKRDKDVKNFQRKQHINDPLLPLRLLVELKQLEPAVSLPALVAKAAASTTQADYGSPRNTLRQNTTFSLKNSIFGKLHQIVHLNFGA